MRMRVFCSSCFTVVAMCAGHRMAAAASQDPRSTITGSSPIDATSEPQCVHLQVLVLRPASQMRHPRSLRWNFSPLFQASGLGLPVYGHDFLPGLLRPWALRWKMPLCPLDYDRAGDEVDPCLGPSGYRLSGQWTGWQYQCPQVWGIACCWQSTVSSMHICERLFPAYFATLN